MYAWKPPQLPEFIVADVTDLKAVENTTLRQKANHLSFPLTEEDLNDIKTLEKKYNSTRKAITGLAAPQIGIPKRIIVFAITKRIASLESCATFPKSVWINPSYENISEEATSKDYEPCYSVKDMIGLVPRYHSIHYKALDQSGKRIEGVAEGCLARLIQHEIDHLDGILYVDHCSKSDLMTFDDYCKKQEAEFKG